MTRDAVEYDAPPMEGSVVVREWPELLQITIVPTVRGVIAAMLFSADKCAAVMLIWAVVGSIVIYALGSGIIVFLFCGAVLCALMVLWAATDSFASFFPQEIELTPTQLRWQWRKVNCWHGYQVSRTGIRALRLVRAPLATDLLRRRRIALRHANVGELLMLKGSRRELRIVADRLRSALGLTEEPKLQAKAVRIDTNIADATFRREPGPTVADPLMRPRGCRYQVEGWGEGVLVVVPPRWERAIAVPLLGVFGVAAFAGAIVLKRYTGDLMNDKWLLLALAAGFGWLMTVRGISKLRRRTVACSEPRQFQVEVTSVLAPLNLMKPWSEVEEFGVEEREGGLGAVMLRAGAGPRQEILAGERVEDLRWLLAVVEVAREGSRGKRG